MMPLLQLRFAEATRSSLLPGGKTRHESVVRPDDFRPLRAVPRAGEQLRAPPDNICHEV